MCRQPRAMTTIYLYPHFMWAKIQDEIYLFVLSFMGTDSFLLEAIHPLFLRDPNMCIGYMLHLPLKLQVWIWILKQWNITFDYLFYKILFIYHVGLSIWVMWLNSTLRARKKLWIPGEKIGITNKIMWYFNLRVIYIFKINHILKSTRYLRDSNLFPVTKLWVYCDNLHIEYCAPSTIVRGPSTKYRIRPLLLYHSVILF